MGRDWSSLRVLLMLLLLWSGSTVLFQVRCHVCVVNRYLSCQEEFPSAGPANLLLLQGIILNLMVVGHLLPGTTSYQ